jgi:putative endonuclease
VDGFTKKYAVEQLVYYELAENMDAAIGREKQLKAGSRKKKINLIEAMNAEWNDLYESII